MPEAIIACHDTLRRGVLKGLVFRRMHFLHLPAPDGLGDLFNDTFLRTCFPFDTLLRSSCRSLVAARHLLDRSSVRIILRTLLRFTLAAPVSLHCGEVHVIENGGRSAQA